MWKRARIRNCRCSRRRCSSRRPKAFCPRRNRRTPSARRWTKRSPRARRAEPRVILFCLSGHGHFDLASYEAYLAGKLQDYEHPGADIARAMATLPK